MRCTTCRRTKRIESFPFRGGEKKRRRTCKECVSLYKNTYYKKTKDQNPPEHKIWQSMIQRCNNSQQKDFARYGGRGISVFKRWESSFTSFLKDVKPRPTSKHTLERIENHKGYQPGNVRWATRKEQARNRRNNRLITYRGKRRTITEWAELIGITREALHFRLERGWSIRKSLTTPRMKN